MVVKNQNSGWSNIQILGLIVIALGVAFLAYSIYVFASVPTIAGVPFTGNSVGPGNFRARFNGTNSTRGNFTPTFIRNGTRSAAFVGVRTSPLLRFGGILSGVLMLLLGIVTFKYGELRKLVTV